MKRSLLAVVVMLASVGMVTADYIMIKIDLNQVSQKLEIPGLTAPGGGVPGGGEGGPGGAPGGGIGSGPGGFGQGGLGLGGQGGMPGPGPGEGGTGTGTGSVQLKPLWAYACLELKSKPKPLSGQWAFVGVIETKYGKQTYLPGPLVVFMSQDDSLSVKFAKRRADVAKRGKEPDRLIELATWALGHGLTKQFHDTMEEFTKLHPKHAVVAAYAKTKADIAKKLTEDDPAVRNLISDLHNAQYKSLFSDQGHYHLLTSLTLPQNEGQNKRYLAKLEETFETFFYWFALNQGGKTLPIPQRRLVAVVDQDPKKFLDKHSLWGNVPKLADGFTPRRENVIFLSSRRTDEVYSTLEKNNLAHMAKLTMNMGELLDGSVWKRPDALNNALPVMILQNLVLIQKAMEDEGERTTISHEGTRQLLAATGLLPRNVEAPEWIQAGIASFFDTSYRAFYTSSAMPSWTHLVAFKHYQKKKKIDPKKQGEVLFNVITDRQFRQARQSSAVAELNKEDNSKLVAQANEDWEIARASAWAFCYYLAKNNKLDQVKRYFEEVSALPRDLEFDDRALAACFARAFDITDPNSPTLLNADRLSSMASEWFSYVDGVALEIVLAEHEGLQAREPPPPPKNAQNTPPPGGIP